MDDDTTQPPPSYNVAGLFRAYYLASGESSPLYGFTNPAHSAAERRSDRISSIFLDCECVIQLQATNEIIGADGILELDAEVVDNECEGNAVIDVAEKTRGTSLQATVGSQTRDEAILGNFPRVR